MKKYQIISTLVIWLFLLFNFYFKVNSSHKDTKVYLRDLNKSVINFKALLSTPSEKIHSNDFKLWDMKISKLLKNRENKKLEDSIKKVDTLKTNKPKEHNVNVKYRTICVEEHCWQLVGIMTINGIKTLTMLNKDKKSKLELFKIGDELLPNIIIKRIKGESMILLNQENHKKIILKLFDVDLFQYLPKKLKEKNE